MFCSSLKASGSNGRTLYKINILSLPVKFLIAQPADLLCIFDINITIKGVT